MASVVTSALYLIFAIAFAMINFLIFPVGTHYEIFHAVSYKFRNLPWKSEPKDYFLDDIKEPGHVYEWLDNVWKPGILDLEEKEGATALVSLNRLLFGRLTLKKFKIQKNESDKFAGPYKEKLGSYRMDASIDNGAAESKEDFGVSYKYQYKENDGYNKAGGFVMYINPEDHDKEVVDMVKTMHKEGWFDLHFGSLVAELMIFNGNVKQFQHLTFRMETTFAGTIEVKTEAVSFDLHLYLFKGARALWNAIRLIFEIIVNLLTIYFVKKEFEDMADSIRLYIENPMCIFDFTCITVVLACTILYYKLIIFADAYSLFTFPLPPPELMEDRIMMFNMLFDVSTEFNRLQSVVGVGVLVVFIRSVILLCQLSNSWGLLFNTLAQGKLLFLYFICVFMLVFIGFALAGHFLFGHSVEIMSTFPLAFINTLTMLLGDPIYPILKPGDAMMIVPFYYLFQLLFSFVLINIFLSIIASSYDKEKQALLKAKMEGKDEEEPLKKLAILIKDGLIKKFSFLQHLTMAKYLVGASTAPKINYETVNRLRAKRRSNIFPFSWECILIVCMFGVFFTCVVFQGRIRTTYKLQEVLEESFLKKEWMQTNPHRKMDFDEIEEFEDVYYFAKNVLFDELYDCTGTAQSLQSCGDIRKTYPKKRENYRLFTGGKVKPRCFLKECSKQSNIGYIPDKRKFQQHVNKPPRVPRVRGWNVGVTSADFVRLTIQIACFHENIDEKSRSSYPHVYSLAQWQCAEKSCMAGFIESGRTCLNSKGMPIDINRFLGRKFGKKKDKQFVYEYQKEGTYLELGGYSIGLGLTREEASIVIEQLHEDHLFKNNVVSMVFDWTLYNGNIDLFAHQATEFSLQPTNYLSKNMKTSIFPLNIFDEGGEQLQNIRHLVYQLLFIYVGCVLIFVLVIVYQVLLELRLCTALQKSLIQTIKSVLFNDPWFLIDMLSVALNVLVLMLFLYVYMGAYDGFIDKFAFINNQTIPAVQKDYATLSKMMGLGDLYMNFLQVAGLNSFFMTIRALKYMSEVHTEVTYVKQDHQPLEEVELKWIMQHRLLQVVSIREGVATNAGIRVGWVINSINGESVLKMFLQFYKERPSSNVEVFFNNKLKRPPPVKPAVLKPLTIAFRSQVGAIGTFMKTFRIISGQVTNFSIVMLLAMLGFVAKFHLDYGLQNKRYSSIVGTLLNLFRFMIGDYEISKLTKQNIELTIINFLIYQLIFYFVLSNMFLATMIQAWRELRTEAMDGLSSNFGAIGLSAKRAFIRCITRQKDDGPDRSQRDELILLEDNYFSRYGALHYLPYLTEKGDIELDRHHAINFTEDQRTMFAERFQKSQIALALDLAKDGYVSTEEKHGADVHEQRDQLKNIPREHEKKMLLKSMNTKEILHVNQSSKSIFQRTKESIIKKLKRNKNVGDAPPSFLESNEFYSGALQRMNDRLEQDLQQLTSPDVAEEVWLDAVITVMEQYGVPALAQKVFKRERQHKPVSTEQKRKFEETKAKFAKALRYLLKYVRVKAAIEHQKLISRAAQNKVKVLRDQSLVFNDYVHKIEEEIANTEKQIAELQQRSEFMHKQMNTIL